jgi:SH3-like domain-containing protein
LSHSTLRVPKRRLFQRLIVSALVLGLDTALASASDVGQTTGLPLPRFVSVKATPANARLGPGINYPLKWTFVGQEVPVEITAEFEHWRRIRDWEGQEGWMLGPLLSGKRTALVTPWRGAKPVSLRASAAADAPIVAIVQQNVLVHINRCDGRWCRVQVKGRRGYIRQTKLWGAYPGEKF